MIVRLIVGVAILYGAVVAGMYVGQRALLYKPDNHRPVPTDYQLENVQPVTLKTADGLDLLAWYRPAQIKDRRTIVYFHGNSGHLGQRAHKVKHYLDQGYGVLLVSWRGFAGNPGAPTEQGLYLDARAAVAFLLQQGLGSHDMIFYGESLGTGVVVQLALEHQPGGVVLEAPYTSIPETAALKYPYLPAKWLVWDQYDSLSKMTQLTKPLLIVHGQYDSLVPVSMGQALYDAAQMPDKTLKILPAGHNDLYDHGAADIVMEVIKTWCPNRSCP